MIRPSLDRTGQSRRAFPLLHRFSSWLSLASSSPQSSRSAKDDCRGSREVMELLDAYTRLLFGATMILVSLCVLIDQIGGALS
jgi:hypothetical protein